MAAVAVERCPDGQHRLVALRHLEADEARSKHEDVSVTVLRHGIHACQSGNS